MEDILSRLAALTYNLGDAVILLINPKIHKTHAVWQIASQKVQVLS